MPVLSVCCMPESVGQRELGFLRTGLQVALVLDLRLASPDDVTVLFPADLLKDGLGEELVCFVDGLFKKPERTLAIRNKVSAIIVRTLGRFAKEHLPQCKKVEVIPRRFNQSTDSFAMCDPRTL